MLGGAKGGQATTGLGLWEINFEILVLNRIEELSIIDF